MDYSLLNKKDELGSTVSSPVVIEKAALLPSQQLTSRSLQSPHLHFTNFSTPATINKNSRQTNHFVSPGNNSAKKNQKHASENVNRNKSTEHISSSTTGSITTYLERELKIKLIVVGGAKVGKTAIVRCFQNLPFVSKLVPTVVHDIFSILYSRTDGGRQVRIDIWDVSHNELTCTDERWARIMAHAAGIIIVCDQVNHRSFEAVDLWRTRIAATVPLSDINLLLMVNKSDLSNTSPFSLTPPILRHYSNIAGFNDFAVVSAHKQHGVRDAFDTLLQDIIRKVMQPTHCSVDELKSPYILSTTVQSSNDLTAQKSGGNSESSLSSHVNQQTIHHQILMPAIINQTYRIIEDLADLGLPTESFVTQKTAAVLTTERPEHIAARREAAKKSRHTLSKQAISSRQTQFDDINAFEGENNHNHDEVGIEDYSPDIPSRVIIMTTSLRQCTTNAYAAFGDILHSQCKYAELDEELTNILKIFVVQCEEEKKYIFETLDNMPDPASSHFVRRSPQMLNLLQQLRTLLLKNIARWQYAFQSFHMLRAMDSLPL